MEKLRTEVAVLVGALLRDGQPASCDELGFEPEECQLREALDRGGRTKGRVVVRQRVAIAVETRRLGRVDLEVVERVLDRGGGRDPGAAAAVTVVTRAARRDRQRQQGHEETRNECATDQDKTQNHHPEANPSPFAEAILSKL